MLCACAVTSVYFCVLLCTSWHFRVCVCFVCTCAHVCMCPCLRPTCLFPPVVSLVLSLALVLVRSQNRVLGLIAAEIAAGIPAERIVLVGFSQGGALSLFTGLQYPGRLVSWSTRACTSRAHAPSLSRASAAFTPSATVLLVCVTHAGAPPPPRPHPLTSPRVVL